MTLLQIGGLFLIIILLAYAALVLYFGHQHDKEQEHLKDDIDKLGNSEPD